MREHVRSIVGVAVTLLTLVVPLRATDTGTLAVTAFDPTGKPVAGATVRILGALLPAGRTAETTAAGHARFEFLAPGEYAVEVERADLGQTRRTAIVEVGRELQVDVLLGVAVTESVTVSVTTPVVDVRLTDVAVNFTASTFGRLPIDRTYRGLFQLAAGVADNRSTVGPAAGGGRQDNTYLVDGANITNPAFGYLGTEVSELDIAEVNIKRGGISAEFGRASGTVINAVTRSGTNQLSLFSRVDWLPDALIGGYRLPPDLVAAGVRPGAFRDPLLAREWSPAVALGGPIVRDRLFFYASARHFSRTEGDRVNKLSAPLPDERRTGRELAGKLTWIPGQTHLATLSYRSRPNEAEHAGLGSDTAPDVGLRSDNSSRIGSASWTMFPTGRSTVNVRYLYMREGNEEAPLRPLGQLGTFDPVRLESMGQYTDPSQANLLVGAAQYAGVRNYRRHEVRTTVTQIVEAGLTSHVIKVGAGFELGEEVLNRTTNGWGAIVNITQSGVPALRARYYTPQPPQVGAGGTWSLFVQDEAVLTRRLSATVGVLLNRDAFSQTVAGSGGCPAVPLSGGAARYSSNGDVCTFLVFGFRDQVQPRVGVSYQPRLGAGDKVYGSWGRYSNMDQKSSARSLAPTRIYQTQTVFDLQGNVLSTGPLASTTGKLIDPDIKPIYANELLVGYATPLAGTYSLDVYVLSRDMHNFIEDVPTRMNGTSPTSGPFAAANLPCTRFEACRLAEAERTYRSLTIDVGRRLAGKWAGNASYTWSRFHGNFDLDYSPISASAAVFNTSSFIQDGPGANVEDANRRGPLFEDRPHVLKLMGSYAVTPDLMVSGYWRVQSGTPWAARGRDWAGATLNFLEPSGTHRNPVWANLDLSSRYRLPLGGRPSVAVELRLLNVLDTQTRLSTDAVQYLDLRTMQTPPYFAPYLQPNPFFGTGNAFAPPRRLHVSAVVEF